MEDEINKYPLLTHNKSMEADIHIYNESELLKIFHFYSENKITTLQDLEEMENELKLVQELLLFKKYISNRKEIIGILIDKGYEIDLQKFLNETLSFQDLIFVFKNIGCVLEQLDYLRKKEHILTNFFIGDIHEKNILVNKDTKQIQFIDLDSSKTKNNRAYLTKYLNFPKTFSYVKNNLSFKYPWDVYNFSNNQNTDLYCYMVILLKALFKIDIHLMNLDTFYKQMLDLKEQGLPEPLFQAFFHLYSPVDNINPYQYLDYIPESFERKRNFITY